jgi:hypothetical protein
MQCAVSLDGIGTVASLALPVFDSGDAVPVLVCNRRCWLFVRRAIILVIAAMQWDVSLDGIGTVVSLDCHFWCAIGGVGCLCVARSFL